MTRRPHSVIIIDLNRDIIIWNSKKNNTPESSTFGSELVALQTSLDIMKGVWYNIGVMGIPIVGTTLLL